MEFIKIRVEESTVVIRNSSENYKTCMSRILEKISPDSFGVFLARKMDTSIEISTDMSLQIEASNSTIYFFAGGNHRIETTGGEFRLLHVRGSIDLSSKDGNNRIEDFQGRLNARIHGGKIVIEDSSGEFFFDLDQCDFSSLSTDSRSQGKMEVSGNANTIEIDATDPEDLMVQADKNECFHQGRRGKLFLSVFANCKSFLFQPKKQAKKEKTIVEDDLLDLDLQIHENNQLMDLFDRYESEIETEFKIASKEEEIRTAKEASEKQPKLSEQEKRLYALVKSGNLSIEEMENILKKN